MKRRELQDLVLKGLQAWFAAQCDGDWEHQYGVTIETLDNPGWRFEADLRGTSLEEKKFEEVNLSRSQQDWIRCRVKNKKFEGFGGPSNLEEIVDAFLRWARE